MSLSPWDLSGNISFDFSLYRPRRPSYVFATQSARRRNESYRHATKSDSNSGDQPGFDFIEGMVRKKRKDSYKAATSHHEDIEMAKMAAASNHVAPSEKESLQPDNAKLCSDQTNDGLDDPVVTIIIPPSSRDKNIDSDRCQLKYRRNLLFLSLSFILVFSAFRAIQNLQSSLNTKGQLGVIGMGFVHGTMFLTCLFTPVLINKLTSKWTIVLGLLFYLFWIAANFYPHFYTLIPTSVGVGFGQSLAWGAQVTYIQKLALDYAQLSKELSQQELFKFNGIFLACFQTSHIWGNLVSSLMLDTQELREGPRMEDNEMMAVSCGVYDSCHSEIYYMRNITGTTEESNMVLKLMGAYLVFAFTGFVLILIFLEKIGAKSDPEKPCLQMVWNNVQQLVKHKTYRLLIPLLLFNGFEQGFIYADYTKSYITCTIGIEYVGYNMITLGMANSIFSILIGMVAKHIPREAIIGIGAILHIGLMVFLLVWIPDQNLFPVFFVISALWGICDAIWQTQCNGLVNMSCPEDHDVAFQNFRMLQGLGAASAFFLGACVCVAVKIHILISLLIVAILFYVVVEYQARGAEDAGGVDGEAEPDPEAHNPRVEQGTPTCIEDSN